MIVSNRLVSELSAEHAIAKDYDFAVWMAGYETRSSWLISSPYRPIHVAKWGRVEFEECRESLSASSNLKFGLGKVVGGSPGHSSWDGHWLRTWCSEFQAAAEEVQRPAHIFIDISSMPRSVYGTAIVAALRNAYKFVGSLTLAYVSGVHGDRVDGSRGLDGLRAIIGTEGTSRHDRDPAFIIGFGFDGVLARTVIEVYQVAHFSGIIADPSIVPGAVLRAEEANHELLSRCELISRAPSGSPLEACAAFLRLADWYSGARDVLLVPLGPKFHVVGAFMASMMNFEIGLRTVQTRQLHPTDVLVPDGTIPQIVHFGSYQP